jgi:hypothetical protein
MNAVSKDMSWAVSLANRGQDAVQIARALSTPGNRKRPAGSVHYQQLVQTRGQEAATRYATRTADKALAFVAENPKITDHAGAVAALVQIEMAAESLSWLVYCGARARRALEAGFVVASRVGRVQFALALREWAEIAGLDFQQIRTARNLLIREGWVRRNPDDRNGRTERLSLSKPPHILSCHEIGMWGYGDRVWLAHDAFRDGALGSIGWAILRGIPSVPTSRDLVFQKIALDPDELWGHLLAFERAGIVTIGDEKIRRSSDDLVPLLDALAVEHGTAGQLLQMKWHHEGERKAWRQRRDVNVGAGDA